MSHNTKSQTNITFTGIEAFKCPIPTCGGRVPLVPADIAAHIISKHKQISKRMRIDGRPLDKAYAFFCKCCESYTNKLHSICHECENPECGSAARCFPTKEALNNHLKADHTKWWFEYKCKFGKECHGLYGGCGFVHHDIPKPFITLDEPLPKYLCRFERPWEGVRCNRDQCSFAHLWGRVRFLIKSRTPKTQTSDDIKPSTPQLTIEIPDRSDSIQSDLMVSPIHRACDCDHSNSHDQALEEIVQKLDAIESKLIVQDSSVDSDLKDICGIKEELQTIPEEEEKVVESSKPDDEVLKDIDYDDGDEDYDEYDEMEDRFSDYDFKPSSKSGGGGGGKQKQSPYTSRHVRIQEQNLIRARERTVVKNAERVQKSIGGFN